MRLTAASLHKCVALALAGLSAAMAPFPASAQQPNPAARAAGPSACAALTPLANASGTDLTLLAGTWNGADLEQRSNCSASQNNGSRGTYAEYVFAVDTAGHGLRIDETGITGLRCAYTGSYQPDPSGAQWSGTYTCTDGKHGTFTSTGFLVTPHEMSIGLRIKLDATETCDIDAILGGSRL
jgi:hypothetical protein